MATNSPNLKVNVTADTSQFSKGMKQAKTDLKDFESVSKDAMTSLGDALGLPIDKLQQLGNAVRGLGTKMSEAGGAGTQAFGKLLTSISGVGTAIAGIGIAGAVMQFKALGEEADNFKTTIQGANIELAKAAYIDTYRQLMHDMNSGVGEAMANTESEWSKFWAKLWTNFKDIVVNMNQFGVTGAATLNNLKSGAAESVSERAAEIARQIYAVQRKISDEMVHQAELDAEIADQKRIAWKNSSTLEEKATAIAKAEELIREKYDGPNGMVALQTQLADLMRQMNGLASSTPGQIDAANQQAVAALGYAKAFNNELRELSEKQNSIAILAEKEAKARKEAAAVAAIKTANDNFAKANIPDITLPSQVVSKQASEQASTIFPEVGFKKSDWADFFAGVDEAFYEKFGDGLQIGVAFDANQGLINLTNQVNSVVADLAVSVGESIGQLVSDLMSGEDAWSNFGNTALSTFADLATTVGKMAIATGTATLGIKAALESLNGYVAIAAGVALVALGVAIKSGLSNAASGNYSASSSVASGSYSTSSSSEYAQQEVNVVVSGTLQASGSTLLAVISNENKRLNHTT